MEEKRDTKQGAESEGKAVRNERFPKTRKVLDYIGVPNLGIKRDAIDAAIREIDEVSELLESRVLLSWDGDASLGLVDIDPRFESISYNIDSSVRWMRIRRAATSLLKMLRLNLMPGTEHDIATVKLDECVMWAGKAVRLDQIRHEAEPKGGGG